MKPLLCTLFALFLGAGAMRADQTTATVQQALKEQGFYYGDVDGKKSADTTAAIRRYQIRNGLQITGEIDAETLRSLGIGSGARRTTPGSQLPSPPRHGEDNDEGPPTQSAEIYPENPPPQAYNAMRPPGPGFTSGPRPAPAGGAGILAGTPYELAPPDLQRHVIVGAQTLLARRGFYRSGIDGEFGPGTEAALRAFQARVGLPADGRLNMETLGALGLLPGQHAPGLRPSRRFWPRPVYRGEWIPEGRYP